MNLFGIVASWVVLSRLMYHCKALPMEMMAAKVPSLGKESEVGAETARGLEPLGSSSVASPSEGNRDISLEELSEIERKPKIPSEHPIPVTTWTTIKSKLSAQMEKIIAHPKKWFQRIWSAVTKYLKKGLARLHFKKEELRRIDEIQESIGKARSEVAIPSEDVRISRQQELKSVKEALKKGSVSYPGYAGTLSIEVEEKQAQLLKTVTEELARLDAFEYLTQGPEALKNIKADIALADSQLTTDSKEVLLKKLIHFQNEQKKFLAKKNILSRIKDLLPKLQEADPTLEPKVTEIGQIGSEIETEYRELNSRLASIYRKFGEISDHEQDLRTLQNDLPTALDWKNIKFKDSALQEAPGKKYPLVENSGPGQVVVGYQRYLEGLKIKMAKLSVNGKHGEYQQLKLAKTELETHIAETESQIDQHLSEAWNSRNNHVATSTFPEFAKLLETEAGNRAGEQLAKQLSVLRSKKQVASELRGDSIIGVTPPQ